MQVHSTPFSFLLRLHLHLRPLAQRGEERVIHPFSLFVKNTLEFGAPLLFRGGHFTPSGTRVVIKHGVIVLLERILKSVRFLEFLLFGLRGLNKRKHLLQHTRAEASELELTATQFVGVPLTLLQELQSASLEFCLQNAENAREQSVGHIEELRRVDGYVENFVVVG